MAYHPDLQPRDYQTLTPLVSSYRLTTAAIEAKRHVVSLHTARKRLDRLAAGRLLTRLRARASVVPPITAPLIEWRPGDPDPDYGAIAYAAQVRWHQLPQRQITVFTASDKLLAMFAMPPRSHLKLHHATHDLGVTMACLYCQERWPRLQFVGEDIFAHERGHGEGIEDAQLVDGDAVVAVVEFAGSYRRHRVKHFHEHVAERELPYYLF